MAKDMGKDIGSGHLLIIGNGHSGTLVAHRVRQKNKKCRITIISRDPYPYYDRRRLVEVVRGACEVEDLTIYDPSYYSKNNIKVRLNQRVSRIDRVSGAAVLVSGETIPFDTLVIATGLAPARTGVIGVGLEGVFNLREGQDAVDIYRYMHSKKCRNMVMIGGGTIGIELALSYRNLEGRVFLVNNQDLLMGDLLDKEASAIIEKHLLAAGVLVMRNDEPVTFDGSGKIERVGLKGGQSLPADCVIVAVGDIPGPSLFREAAFSSDRGIPVNSHMRTADPDIYAVGVIADHEELVGGGWRIGQVTSDIAAKNILGENVTIPANIMKQPTILRLPDLEIVSIAAAQSRDAESITRNESQNNVWWRIYVRDGFPVGGVFVNSSHIGNLLVNAVAQGHSMNELIDEVRSSGTM